MGKRGLVSGRSALWCVMVVLCAVAHGCGRTTGDAGSGGSGGDRASGGSASGGHAAGGSPSGGASAAGASGGGASGGSASGGSGPHPALPGASGYDCSPATGSVPELQATPVVTDGLGESLYLTHEPNGDPDRLFVLDRAGFIRIIEGGVLLDTPFLDFSSKVGSGGEQGALGLAFAPDYAESGLFYVHYSDGADGTHGDSIFEEYQVTGDADVADPDSGRVLLRVDQPETENHKGGSIAFGADGLLYIGLGDGGGGGDPSENGQNVDSFLGKLLRIDPVPSSEDEYTIPDGNLWDALEGAAPEVWDYGLRNPFRFSFDGCTGDLYIGDVGQDRLEELDIERAGEGQKNYGWNTTEGLGCYDPASDCDRTGIKDPVLDYDHDTGKSITGGSVYRGRAIPALRGTYFYADYQNNLAWSLVYDRGGQTISTPVSRTQELNNVTQIVAITNGADGELYFVSRQGGVYKLEAAE